MTIAVKSTVSAVMRMIKRGFNPLLSESIPERGNILEKTLIRLFPGKRLFPFSLPEKGSFLVFGVRRGCQLLHPKNLL
jgi:hypothetical protein